MVDIFWTSPCGKYVVVHCNDIPPGTVRSPNRTTPDRVTNFYVGNETSNNLRIVAYGSGQGYYAMCLKSDLGIVTVQVPARQCTCGTAIPAALAAFKHLCK